MQRVVAALKAAGGERLLYILDEPTTGLHFADIEKLLDICDNILGRSFCALGDGATSPITSSIQYFRDEYIAHLTHGGCPFDPYASMLAAPEGVGR